MDDVNDDNNNNAIEAPVIPNQTIQQLKQHQNAETTAVIGIGHDAGVTARQMGTLLTKNLIIRATNTIHGRVRGRYQRRRDAVDLWTREILGNNIQYYRGLSQDPNSECAPLQRGYALSQRGPLMRNLHNHATGDGVLRRSEESMENLRNSQDPNDIAAYARLMVLMARLDDEEEGDSEDEITSEEEEESDEEESDEEQDLEENDEEQQFDIEEEEEDDDQEEEDDDFDAQSWNFDSDEEVDEPPNLHGNNDGGGDDDSYAEYHDALEGREHDNDEFYDADDNIPPQNNTLNNNINNILNMPANNVGNNNNKRKGWRKKLSSVSSVAGIIGAIGIITLLSSVLCPESTSCGASVRSFASSVASSAKDISSSLRGKLSCLEGILSDANVTLVSDDTNEENNYPIIRTRINLQDETAISIDDFSYKGYVDVIGITRPLFDISIITNSSFSAVDGNGNSPPSYVSSRVNSSFVDIGNNNLKNQASQSKAEIRAEQARVITSSTEAAEVVSTAISVLSLPFMDYCIADISLEFPKSVPSSICISTDVIWTYYLILNGTVEVVTPIGANVIDDGVAVVNNEPPGLWFIKAQVILLLLGSLVFRGNLKVAATHYYVVGTLLGYRGVDSSSNTLAVQEVSGSSSRQGLEGEQRDVSNVGRGDVPALAAGTSSTTEDTTAGEENTRSKNSHSEPRNRNVLGDIGNDFLSRVALGKWTYLRN